MKKRNFLFFLAAPLLLVSCGGNSEEVIPTGETVPETEVSTHFKKATESLGSADAVGMKLELSGKGVTEMKSMTGDSTLTMTTNSTIDASLKAGVKGLRAPKAQDIKGSVSGNLGMDSKTTISTDGSDKSSSESSMKANLKAAAYVDGGYVYFDVGDLGPYLEIIGSITGENITADANLKGKFSFLKDADYPNPIPTFLEEIEWDEVVAQAKDTFSEELDTIKTKAGDYAYVFKGDSSKIFGVSSTDEVSTNISGEVTFSISFNDLGLTALGFKTNTEISTSAGGIETKFSMDLSAKASFFYGDNVTVEDVPNPSSFTEMK